MQPKQYSPSFRAFRVSAIITLLIWAYMVFKWFFHSAGQFDDTRGLFFFFVPIMGLMVGVTTFLISYLLFVFEGPPSNYRVGKIILVAIPILLIVAWFLLL